MTRPDDNASNRLEKLGRGLKAHPAAAEQASGNPPFCGVIDLVIGRDGQWHYHKSPIGRREMVKLFASVLRREADGHYYLVTPVEKCQITVEDAPFLAVAMEVAGAGAEQQISLITNLDERVAVGPQHPLRFAVEEKTLGLKPYVGLRDGLEALVNRALYYDLIGLGVVHGAWFGLWSGGQFFPIARINDEPEGDGLEGVL